MKHLLLALLFVSASAFGGQCDSVYPHGQVVDIPGTTEYCSSFFQVSYSNEMKGPIVSFEKIPNGPHNVTRVNSFRQDERILKQYRATLGDYLNSGCDKGHMTPFDDASDSAQGRETFRLSNMTCQSKKLNEVAWRMLEDHVRFAFPGTTYVATGAIYGNDKLGKSKIGIPVSYYKIAWYSNGTVEAFIADNKDSAKIKPTTISSINKLTGYNFPLK